MVRCHQRSDSRGADPCPDTAACAGTPVAKCHNFVNSYTTPYSELIRKPEDPEPRRMKWRQPDEQTARDDDDRFFTISSLAPTSPSQAPAPVSTTQSLFIRPQPEAPAPASHTQPLFIRPQPEVPTPAVHTQPLFIRQPNEAATVPFAVCKNGIIFPGIQVSCCSVRLLK